MTEDDAATPGPRTRPARVAIVMRTKDRPLLLQRAVADVVAQTYRDWTLVIVNDAGDPSPVDALVAAVPEEVADRIAVLHRDESAGIESASNAGVDATTSEYLAIHDDDDTWEPTFLERAVAHLDAHTEVGVVVRADIVHEEVRDGAVVETGREPYWPDLPAISLSDLIGTNRFVPIQLLYRRRAHDVVGPFREDLPVVGDWDFHLRLARTFSIGLIDDVLAHWHQRPTASDQMPNRVLAARGIQDRVDLQLRDQLLKEHVAQHGMGDLLYLTRYLRGEFDLLHERIDQLERQLAALGDAPARNGYADRMRRGYRGPRKKNGNGNGRAAGPAEASPSAG